MMRTARLLCLFALVSVAPPLFGQAAEASVRELTLFHHDPEHDDGQVDALLAMARAAAPAGLTVGAAREGWTVTL